MRGIFIDPFTRMVTEIDLPEKGDSVDIVALISMMNCNTFDVARLTLADEEIDCYVDDNGLFVQDQAFFIIAGRPLAGKAILLGRTDWWECVPPRATLETVCGAVQWANRRYAQAAIEMQTRAAMAHAVAHGAHVESNGPYGFISTPSAIDPDRDAKEG
ncbi:hypothetical protein GALL_464430 [mine drainage metagenome]|uniref:Uncharacterized protein n=1 Tax=mine drainage metagenome TaxID=410659 RepID=A0A1J5PLA8_9ZZZZ